MLAAFAGYFAAALLEIGYCALATVAAAKILLTGAMVPVGAMVGWFADRPSADPLLPGLLFVWLAAWEIGGRIWRACSDSGAARGDGSARPELGGLIRSLEGVYPQADRLDALMRRCVTRCCHQASCCFGVPRRHGAQGAERGRHRNVPGAVARSLDDRAFGLRVGRVGADGAVEGRRPTLPVLLAYRDGGPTARAASHELWELPPELALDALTGLVTAGGALESARAVTADYAAKAQRALDALPPGSHRDPLAALAEHVVTRTQ